MSAPYHIWDYPPPDDGFTRADIPGDAILTPQTEFRFVGGILQQRFLVEARKVTFMVYLPVPNVRE